MMWDVLVKVKDIIIKVIIIGFRPQNTVLVGKKPDFK